MTDLVAPPSSNGDTAPPSTHELLRLRVQERLRCDGADDLSVHRTGTRDDGARAIRDRRGLPPAESDKGIARRPAEPSVRDDRPLGTQPARGRAVHKYFNNSEYADRGGAARRDHGDRGDGRLSVDAEPTCEAELTAITARLLAQAGATVDLEHTIVVHQIWDNQVRASVSIPTTGKPGLHVPHLPQRTTFEDLVEWNSHHRGGERKAFATGKTRMVAAGEPGSGKSTRLPTSRRRRRRRTCGSASRAAS